MFVITVNRKKITKIALAAVCIVAVGAAGIRVKGFFEKDSATAAAARKTKLSTTQEMVDYIAQKGFTADMQTAQVAEVQIPKKFDDSFTAFNEKIKQNDEFDDMLQQLMEERKERKRKREKDFEM